MVQIVFPKDWSPTGGTATYNANQFVVQRASDISFTSPTTVPGPYSEMGEAYIALDSPWTGSQAPFYRVRLMGSNGAVIGDSFPSQPLEQAGKWGFGMGAAWVQVVPWAMLSSWSSLVLVFRYMLTNLASTACRQSFRGEWGSCSYRHLRRPCCSPLPRHSERLGCSSPSVHCLRHPRQVNYRYSYPARLYKDKGLAREG